MNDYLLEEYDNTTKNLSLAVEMIDPQLGDPVVEALVREFTQLRDVIKSDGIMGGNVLKNRLTANLIKNIDNILKERFGITFKHVYQRDSGYGVLTTPPNNYNILKDGNIKIFEDVVEGTKKYKDILKSQGKTHSDKEIVDINNSERDNLAINEAWIKAVKDLDNVLEKDGVWVDLAKARIDNLPDKYIVFLMCDLSMLVNTVELTPKELTAVLLHEVGHAFTHIEYSIRTVKNTAVLLDTFRKITNKNTTPTKTMNIVYRKLYNSKIDIDKGNVVTAGIRLLDSYVKSNYVMGRNTYSNTDSEQLADQFSNRFGLGVELGSSVDKYRKFDISLSKITSAVSIGMVVVYSTVFSIITMSSALLGLPIAVGIIIMSLGIWYIFNGISNLLTDGGLYKGTEYDYDKRRYQRIKNDLVRVLRSSNLGNKAIKEQLTQIENLDKLIELAKDENDSITSITKFIRDTLPGAKLLVETKRLDQLTEDLMENDLYISSNKLKTLKR